MPPPPLKQLPLLLVIDRFRLRVPQWVGLVVLAVAVPTGLWAGLGDSRRLPPTAPVPSPTSPPMDLQTSTYAPYPLVMATLGRLPDGVDTQRKPPCDPDAEEAIGGWCWIPLAVEKCPTDKGKAFEHNGKCYLRALRAARSPTTGEPRPFPVAGPAD